jgi:hypothetical protein
LKSLDVNPSALFIDRNKLDYKPQYDYSKGQQLSQKFLNQEKTNTIELNSISSWGKILNLSEN